MWCSLYWKISFVPTATEYAPDAGNDAGAQKFGDVPIVSAVAAAATAEDDASSSDGGGDSGAGGGGEGAGQGTLQIMCTPSYLIFS